jgi:sugar phosphate isomerase/epimerase
MPTLCFNTFNDSAWHGIPARLPEQARAAAAAGFRMIGPDVFSVEQHGDPAGFAAELETLGLECFETAALTIDGSSLEAQLGPVERTAGALRPAWLLTNVDVAADVAVEELGRLAERLAPLDVRIALEYLPFTRMRCIADTVELIERARLGERAGVLVDTWHFFFGPDQWRDLEALPLEQIAYVQFDDHPGRPRADLTAATVNDRVFPGEGIFDIPRFAATLRAKGFDGVLSVEVLHAGWRGGDLGAFAQRCYTSSARAWPGAS